MLEGLMVKKTLLFSICLFILTTPVRADVWGDYEYTDNGDTTCTITGYLGPGGDVTIPDTLDVFDVNTIGDSAF
ncbi:MAG: hypothetical protein ABFR90_10365 [Planctomycetota bacterium]